MLLAYLSGQVGERADAALRGKLRFPQYGNLVDHDTLFNGSINEPAYSPARRWLVSPQIFLERVMDLFELNSLDTRRRNDMLARGFYGVTNPFVFTTDSGVRDYDNRMLTGGHLLVMRGNAKWIADKQIFATKNYGKPRQEIVHRNPKDQWYPSGFAPEPLMSPRELPPPLGKQASEPCHDDNHKQNNDYKAPPRFHSFLGLHGAGNSSYSVRQRERSEGSAYSDLRIGRAIQYAGQGDD